MSDERLELLTQWLAVELGDVEYNIEPASADASFRRYFRISFDGKTIIAMDAPPEVEDCSRFIRTAKMFAAIGVSVPLIQAEDLKQGFLLISDLGSRQYMDELNQDTVDSLYDDALDALITIQASGLNNELPQYDLALLLREMEIFREWYLQKHIQYLLDDDTNKQIDNAFEFLAKSALEQPRVIVHRDYHSRNLMVLEHNNPGIVDFQDAVVGPVTYDLVSLLKDCYIEWPVKSVKSWMSGFHEKCLQLGILKNVDQETFECWFDLMGVQRHLKAAGIFARLNYRDGKPGYLADIPRTLGYVKRVVVAYPELAILKQVLDMINISEHKLN